MEEVRDSLWRAFCLVVSIVFGVALYYANYCNIANIEFSQDRNKHIQEIYHKLVVSTGRANEVPLLLIVNLPTINAYTNGEVVVIYTGMIDASKNDDEIALILGHEIAHVLLEHVGKLSTNSPAEQEVLESMADKMGAYYMMRAGYDLCTGREIWKRFLDMHGDYMGGDHPDMAYRYSQLNVQCGAH